MKKIYRVTSVMEVDYICEVEMEEGSTESEIIQFAETNGDWDTDRHADPQATDKYFVNWLTIAP